MGINQKDGGRNPQHETDQPRNNTEGTRGNSNQPAEEHRRSGSGGNMGAGKSGNEDLGSEKSAERDNFGSRKPTA